MKRAATHAATLPAFAALRRWLDRLPRSPKGLLRLALSGCLACGSALANDTASEPDAVPSTHFYAVTRTASGFAHDDIGLWLGRGPTSLGVGIAVPTHTLSAPGLPSIWMHAAGTPTLSLGMRYRISDRSRLYFDAGLHSQRARETDAAERPLRVGMEFKSAPVPTLGLAHGALLRTQLSATSTVSLKMRRGGVSVMLGAKF
jgi:hypothetical protein